MDENILLNALDSDPQIRIPAEAYIKNSLENPGVLIHLFSIYENTQNPQIKLASLILAKNSVIRN